MQHAYELALLGLAHIDIEGLVRHVPEGQEAGQEEGATACTCDQVGRIQQDCDDGSDGRPDGEAEVGGHGGSSDGLTLQDISPEELWDALCRAIEEGEAHGSGGLGELGLDQLGPDSGPAFRVQVFARHDPAGLALNGNGQFRRRNAQSVCAVLQMAHGRAALGGEVRARILVGSGEVLLEVHGFALHHLMNNPVNIT